MVSRPCRGDPLRRRRRTASSCRRSCSWRRPSLRRAPACPQQQRVCAAAFVTASSLAVSKRHTMVRRAGASNPCDADTGFGGTRWSDRAPRSSRAGRQRIRSPPMAQPGRKQRWFPTC